MFSNINNENENVDRKEMVSLILANGNGNEGWTDRFVRRIRYNRMRDYFSTGRKGIAGFSVWYIKSDGSVGHWWGNVSDL